MKKYPLFAIVLLGSLLVGCTDDFDGFYEFDEYTPSVIMQANQLIESGKIKVSLLDLERAYMSETSKNSKANSKRDFSIEWSDYRVKTEGTVDVVYVPIKLNKKKNQIFTLQTEDGRMKGFSHQFYCTLIMASGKDGKGFEAVMATYLYGGNMKEDDIKRMGRTLNLQATAVTILHQLWMELCCLADTLKMESVSSDSVRIHCLQVKGMK